MGIFTRDRTPAPRRPLVASGRAIELTDTQQAALFRRRLSQDDWQSTAGLYNASLAIVGFGHDYVRDSMSRVLPIPAILDDDPSKPPVPLTKETAPDGLDPALCDTILQRLAPFPQYMGQIAHKLDIFGEVHVALLEDPIDGDGEEEVKVFSPLELYMQGSEWRWKRDRADSTGTPLDKDIPFWRIWQPDPEYSELPYSHMIRILGACKALLLLEKLVTSLSTSRLATTGKIIAIADEFSLETPVPDGHSPTDDAGDGERGDLIDDFFAAAEAGILNPDAAAAMLPLMFVGPRDLIKDGINVIDISRTFEDTLLKIRQEMREEIATGMNLPREILLGVGNTNHWNADAIREQAWLEHLEPRAMTIVNATTTSYYRPALLANGVDPDVARRCVVWYDPTWFLGSPDRADGADQGLKDFTISMAAWREAKGYSDDDAPTDEEIQRRIGWIQQTLVRTTIREDAGAGQEVQVADPAKKAPAVPIAPAAAPKDQKVGVPDSPDASAPTPDAKPLTASGAPPSKLDRLPGKLVAIERDARTRLHAQTEAALTATLQRAGMKARTEVQRMADRSSRVVRDQNKALLAQVAAVPKEGIVAALGRSTIAAYGLDDQKLLAGALAGLDVKYHQIVRRAQLAAAQAAADAAGRTVDLDQVDQATKGARDAGWVVLAAGIMALANDLLYNPHPEAPTVGEFDPDTVVPIGLIRAALDVAGGAQVGAPDKRGVPTVLPARSTGPGGPPGALGVTQGPTMLDEFKQQLGIIEDTYTWVYGDAPRKEFPPHLDLDGVTFTSWDDDVLINNEGWPPNPYFFPNDHVNCGCDVLASFTQAAPEEPS